MKRNKAPWSLDKALEHVRNAVDREAAKKQALNRLPVGSMRSRFMEIVKWEN